MDAAGRGRREFQAPAVAHVSSRSRPRRSKCLASRDPYSITSSARPWTGEREREPPRLGSLHVDDQLDPRGLLHRQVGRLLALENPGVDADLTVQIPTIFAVAHETADRSELAKLIDRGGPHIGTPVRRRRGQSRVRRLTVGPGLQRPSRNRVRCSRAQHGVAARGRGPQLEVLYASTEADIDTLVNVDQVYGTAGDESVCRQHGQRLLWYVVVVFLRRTLVYVILIRMESNEV